MYYAKEFRKKVIEYAKTHTARKTTEAFHIAMRTLFRWKKLLREKGSLDMEPLNRKPRKLDIEKLKQCLEEYPYANLRELAKLLEVSVGCVFKALRKMKVTSKKRQGSAGNRTMGRTHNAGRR